jgi:hypothetical protein
VPAFRRNAGPLGDLVIFQRRGPLPGEGALRSRPDTQRNSGKCNAFSWGGERQWLHGPDKPGARIFCDFDGNDAVAVWTHERLGQPTHRDILLVAREGGSDHAGLTRWWRPWHHLIGKAQ